MGTMVDGKRYPYSTESDDILEHRAEELALLRKPVEADTRPMLLMRVGGIDFAMAQQHIRRIISPLSLVPVPYAHPCVKGITHAHGELVSVIDFAILLGAPATHVFPPSHAVLFDHGESPFCISLDCPPDTCVVPTEDISSGHSYPVEWARPVVDGMFLFDQTTVGILSLQRLISHPAFRSLAERNEEGT